MSADQSRLFVVCSDANAVAVVDICAGGEPRARVRADRVVSDRRPRRIADGRLVVLNGRGVRSFPNPKGRTRRVRPARCTKAVTKPWSTSAGSRPARRL